MLSVISPSKMHLILQNIRGVIKVSLLFDIGLKVCPFFFKLSFRFNTTKLNSIWLYLVAAEWLCSFVRLCCWGFCSSECSSPYLPSSIALCILCLLCVVNVCKDNEKAVVDVSFPIAYRKMKITGRVEKLGSFFMEQ